jgi:eukaryotic-like serine/threonine-protein kinase
MTGRVIAGRYNLQHPIGRGAMGVVWRAHDQLLDRDVAVKEVVISALIGADERRNAYQRTLREARTAARLSHRGVVAVYDVAEEDGRPWIVMELVPSQSLDQALVVEGRLPPARAGRIGQQLLSALAAAHAAGVLHRDVKPSNVLIATSRTGEGWDERAVLTDFGIAQFEGDPRLTQTGMVMGSPGFTAPERIRGSDATPASDLWSLGATIYAAVEGRGPYENRGGAITTMTAIINEDAPVAPHAGRLAPVIAALLRRDPTIRPSASAAARMFAQVLPQLSEATEEPASRAHPPTVRSAYVPAPAAPAVSSSVTAPDARPALKPAPTVKKAPAAETPAAEEKTQEAPESPSVDEAAEVNEADEANKANKAAAPVSADLAAEEGSADGADSAPEPDAEAETERETGETGETGGRTDSENETGREAESGAAVEAAAAAAEEEAEEAAAEAELAEEEAEDEAKPAPETKKMKIPAVVAKVPVPEAVPADAAAAVVLGTARSAEEPESRAAETVVPAKGALRYQPPQVPVARLSPSAPVQPLSTDQPKPAEPKPAPPKPTFTAAKQANRVAPSFSAASPARPASPGRPTPARTVTPPDQRPSYSPAGAGQGYSPAKGQYPSSGAQYAPQGGQYPGPAQAFPDLGRQYPPGTGGGRASRGLHGRRRQLIWLAVAIVIAAAIGVGTALALSRGASGSVNAGNTGGPTTVPSVADTPTSFESVEALNNPSTALPGAGWSTKTVTRADAQSNAAGFSVDLPPGWTETRDGLATSFSGPGDLLFEVDLTQQPTTDMLSAATQVEAGSQSQFRDYQQVALTAVPVRHAEGAVWKFQWTPAGGVQLTADDIFFPQSTSSGVQDYAVYIRSPSSTFGSGSLSIFDAILRTFQTVSTS